MHLFSVDGPLYRFMQKLTDVLVLSLMWLLFSLPLITIGAATTAGMSVAMDMADDQEGKIIPAFWAAFKANWRQGIPVGLILLVGWYAVYLDFQLFEAVVGNPVWLLIVGMLTAFLVTLATAYTFPLLARYDNTVARTLRNSVDIARKYYGQTLLMVLLVGAELLLCRWNVTMLLLGTLLGPGCILLTVGGMSKRVFERLEKEQAEEG
ncbi:MAG: YesL family protein [Aristaeellaceae bacterium]